MRKALAHPDADGMYCSHTSTSPTTECSLQNLSRTLTTTIDRSPPGLLTPSQSSYYKHFTLLNNCASGSFRNLLKFYKYLFFKRISLKRLYDFY